MATYGKTTQGASPDNTGNARMRLNSGVFPENGTLDSISAWVDNVNTTGNNIIFLVYDSSDALVAVSEQNTTTQSTAHYITLPVLGSIPLVAGETYGIAMWGESNGSRIYYDSGTAGDGAFATAATWPTAPDPFVLDFEIARDYSIAINYTPSAASGPVITGPAGLVDGVSDTIDGTGFDTATVDLSLAGGNTVVQAVSGQTATAITITPANVVTEPTTGVAQAAVPYTVTDVAAAGTTAYTLDVDVTNTDLSTDSNPITLASSASEQTVQAMVATSVTTAGSVFDSSMIAVEDDMQVTAPLTVAPATYFTIAADGTYTHDADTTIVVPLKFYSPTTKQLSYAELTLEGIAVVARNMTEWIEANGAGGQTNEAWLKYMLGAGASGKTFNDLMFDWLGILGYTGSLTERVAKWNEANLG